MNKKLSDIGDVIDHGSHQAFPCNDRTPNGHYGLTKREWFAGMAMQGMAANPEWGASDIANYAVDQADTIIAKLNKAPEAHS